LSIDPNNDSSWKNDTDRPVWANFKWTVVLGTSGANRGSFSVVSTTAHHQDDKGNLKVNSSEPPSDDTHKPGVWQAPAPENPWYDGLLTGGENNRGVVVANVLGSYVSDVSNVMNNAIKGLDSNLKATIILPAGDVFLFKGLSCDSNANLLSIVTYDTPTSGEMERKPAEGWSFARMGGWVQPK
jgi:hypothetical protein